MLLGGADAMLFRHVFSGLQHRMAAERIAAEIVHDPVLGRTGAARTLRVRVVQVRAVRRAVAVDDECGLGHSGTDFLGAGEQRAHAGGARLHHRRAAGTVGADQAGQPRQAVERVLLRHREAEHAVIEDRRIDRALLQFGAGDVGGKFDAVQVGETALPAREGSAPVHAVRNFCAIGHDHSSSCKPMAMMKAWRACIRCC